MRSVRGMCPACGWRCLFLGNGGYVTCSISDCPNPGAAHDLLEGTSCPREEESMTAPLEQPGYADAGR